MGKRQKLQNFKLMKISQLTLRNPEINEIYLNPVFVLETGMYRKYKNIFKKKKDF